MRLLLRRKTVAHRLQRRATSRLGIAVASHASRRKTSRSYRRPSMSSWALPQLVAVLPPAQSHAPEGIFEFKTAAVFGRTTSAGPLRSSFTRTLRDITFRRGTLLCIPMRPSFTSRQGRRCSYHWLWTDTKSLRVQASSWNSASLFVEAGLP